MGPPAKTAALRIRCDWATILVHAEASSAGERRIKAAAALALRLDAFLIGLGAQRVENPASADGSIGGWSPQIAEMIEAQAQENLKIAESVFRLHTNGIRSEWRSTLAGPTDALAQASRAADVIVAGGSVAGRGDGDRVADTAQIAIQSARPVLVTPNSVGELQGRRIVLAWKDTREARRAVADSMPLLLSADEVRVCEVCEDDQTEYAQARTLDVAHALERRGATPTAKVLTAHEGQVADALNAEANAFEADLIVAGCYGHSRIHEWLFGGVTRSLLHDPERFLVLSH